MSNTSKNQYLDRHGNPIDVYTYPDGADHQALRDYQHAVEVAHERDGLPVEFFYAKTMEWQAVVPDFYWDRRKYRIKASKLAEGHNPDKLTEEQVGVSDGWRLLESEEIAERVQAPSIDMWLSPCHRWVGGTTAGSPIVTYRTKMPPGYFLTKKQETDKEAIDRIWRKHSHNYGNDFRDGLREILQWERERVRNGGEK